VSTEAVVDRAGLEKLLKIQRRTAIRLLHQFGARAVGATLAIERLALIRALESLLPDGAGGKPARTPSQLGRLHQEAEAIRFPDVRSLDRRTVDRLPTAIQLAKGQLTIEVADLRDLCAQLWVLLETCQDDWRGVEKQLAGAAE